MAANLNVEEWTKASAEMARAYSAMTDAEAKFNERKKAYEAASARCTELMAGGGKKRGRKAVGAEA